MHTSHDSTSSTSTVTPTLYLIDKQLLDHFRKAGAPLPFGIVRLIQDRQSGCLGGVPYRQVGGKFVYNPEEVTRFLAGLPIIQGQQQQPTVEKKRKSGRPSAGEIAEAMRRGVSISELRSAV